MDLPTGRVFSLADPPRGKREAFDKMLERGRMNDRRLHLTPMRTESFFILPHEENFQDPFWLF
ncbi:unnamed protein product [Prunus armeniaca]|uniref:Uncharacterized protein n=1 Tax=Prunus armeniaca TaxID=36596 RepID=A0A6J5US82_PRUAR|nr:unnamed protein product [Prunus armeniaca]